MSPLVLPALIGLAFPVKRTQLWNTSKNDALSGKRTRYPLWSYPQWEYEISFELLRSDNVNAELQTLAGFIASVYGPALLWQYDDPSDDAVTLQLFGEGDGVSTAFQLVRTFGGFTQPVFLVNGAPAIFVDGVLKTVTTDYTISPYGKVNFVAAPSNGALLQWTGTFYWGCRFDDDATDFSQFMATYWELKSLKFSTEKL